MKDRCVPFFATAVALAFAIVSVSVHAAAKVGQSARITVGTVERAEQVDLQSEAGKGALVGGTLGLISAGGKSSGKKIRNALIGAGAGAAVASSAQGSRNGMAYTVRAGDANRIRIVTDQTEVRVGDCVAVEESGGTANLRRVANTLCDEASARARGAVEGTMQQEAAECYAAKRELVDASTADALDLAKRKVEILCAS